MGVVWKFTHAEDEVQSVLIAINPPQFFHSYRIIDEDAIKRTGQFSLAISNLNFSQSEELDQHMDTIFTTDKYSIPHIVRVVIGEVMAIIFSELRELLPNIFYFIITTAESIDRFFVLQAIILGFLVGQYGWLESTLFVTLITILWKWIIMFF